MGPLSLLFCDYSVNCIIKRYKKDGRRRSRRNSGKETSGTWYGRRRRRGWRSPKSTGGNAEATRSQIHDVGPMYGSNGPRTTQYISNDKTRKGAYGGKYDSS